MGELKVLIDEKTLQEKIGELAEEIMKDYEGKDITFICILKGSVLFTVDLAKKIKNNVRLEFIRVSSYGDSQVSSGKVTMKLDLQDSIEGRDVIVIEDIIDTGRTLSYLRDYLKDKNPASLKICTLLDKKERREFDIEPDYTAFVIPDKFVVGYGLDDRENFRNLPYVGYFDV
ncbi:MAG: hypoxanthine phosphoribosyltransferase [Clostridia bacterium]|nr:hypoxanthine phosphoribosyltransferase [Clostridia bacterium]